MKQQNRVIQNCINYNEFDKTETMAYGEYDLTSSCIKNIM